MIKLKYMRSLGVAGIVGVFLLLPFNLKSQEMKFACGKTDTMYVGIKSDTDYVYSSITFRCSKHEHNEIIGLILGLDDGSYIEVLREDGWDIVNNDKLRCLPLSYILFETQNSTSACVRIKTKMFFIDHFKQVKK